MADINKTLELIQKRQPVSGKQVALLQLSLKKFEEAGWIYDRVSDTMNPPLKGP